MQVYARCGALFQTRGGKEGVEVAGKAGRSIEASPEGEGYQKRESFFASLPHVLLDDS